ncbi:phosphate ABC transporter substrate-binding/OmpA family protein [uncultured Thalassolituus sp.]|uniref:phosphate ABC transporter substrate-binding/OmpA family protein n=1 Tax=uncultured Thalassolituus sp. TaxID=285273 RepID=UPI0026199729|nr:phosphate ABC transporter substrate-binding/OmpA family protein [uncultured Thalassolituus sp.]
MKKILRPAFLTLLLVSGAVQAQELFSELSAGYYEKLFRIDGSNTIGAELAPALVKSWMVSRGAEQVQSVSNGGGNEVRISGYVPVVSAHIYVDIAAHGSGTGFKALAQGATDIAAASRPVKDKEQAAMPAVNLSSAESEHVVGIDGLAIIVHPENPLQQLQVTQIRDLFTGRISNWKELGGLDEPVSVFARDENSGTWDSFRHMVLGSAALREGTPRFESNNDLSDRVSVTPGAVGFVGLASVRNARAIAVSAGQAAGLFPEKLTVATEDYALSRRLYLYTAGRPANAYVRDFLEFAAHEGQEQVAEVGFVSQSVTAVKPAYQAQLPDQIRKTTEGAYRLTVNFRFEEGSARLDNKAQRDVDRLLEFVSDYPEAAVILGGFGDSRLPETMTQLLSKHRAMAVSRALRQAAVYPKLVTGYGSELPVADVEGNDGRQKNSRVEVWVRQPHDVANLF